MSTRSNSRRDTLFRVIVTVLVISIAALAAAIALQSRVSRRQRFALPTATPAAAVVDAATAAPDEAQTPSEEADVGLPSDPSPEPSQGLLTAEAVTLPVFTRADTTRHAVALTLDSCTNAEVLSAALDMARQYGAKLTLFPSGSVVTGAELGGLIETAVVQMGCEVENRTWNNARLFKLDTLDMAKDIWGTHMAVEYALNQKYGMHLLRPAGGQGLNDPRTSAYLKQLGYDGYVTWSMLGTNATIDQLRDSLQPGQIYLFNCTEADVLKLTAFMKYLQDCNYEMVTVSELLGFGEVRPEPYEGDLMEQLLPVPEEYQLVRREFSAGDQAWQVLLIQSRLAQLGYLTVTNADGMFGETTSRAVTTFQAEHNLACTGIASVEMQNVLFSDEAREARVQVTEAPSPTPSPAFGVTPPPSTTPEPTLPSDSVSVPGEEEEGASGEEEELLFQ